MSNVLSEEKKQQVIALGKLGWPLRRIEQVTGIRRETANAYLKSAGVVVCLPGWGRRAPAGFDLTTEVMSEFECQTSGNLRGLPDLGLWNRHQIENAIAYKWHAVRLR